MSDIPPPRFGADTLISPDSETYRKFREVRGSDPFGPFLPLSHSPELMLSAAQMGEYIRYRSQLPFAVRELAILLVSRHYDQSVEWEYHEPEARRAGVPDQVILAVSKHGTPPKIDAQLQVTWSVVIQLLHHGRLTDEAFAAAEAQFGIGGCVDLTGLVGYYSLLAMILNVARTPPSKGPLPTVQLASTSQFRYPPDLR